MLLWVFIMAAVMIAAIAAFIYLVNRFYRLMYGKSAQNEKRTKEKNVKAVSDNEAENRKNSKSEDLNGEKDNNLFKRIIMSLVPVLVISIGLIVLMGTMNAIICILHLVIFWLFSDLIIFVIGKLCKKTVNQCINAILAFSLTIIYLSIGWYLVHNVWMTGYEIKTNKNIDNLRIVQFADSHMGTTFSGKDFQKYVDEMQAQNPDVVVITGDLVDDGSVREDMIETCKALGTLKTTYGVYYCFGNHDKGYYNNSARGFSADELVEELEKNGVVVLEDETIFVDDKFYIIGRQDRSEEAEKNGGRASMEEIVKDLDKSKYMIVLDHQPVDYEAQEKSEVDLVLSGHTHGGQLIPIQLFIEYISENDAYYGHEKRSNTDYIVTSGISDWEILFKTGCKSEYVVIDVLGE